MNSPRRPLAWIVAALGPCHGPFVGSSARGKGHAPACLLVPRGNSLHRARSAHVFFARASESPMESLAAAAVEERRWGGCPCVTRLPARDPEPTPTRTSVPGYHRSVVLKRRLLPLIAALMASGPGCDRSGELQRCNVDGDCDVGYCINGSCQNLGLAPQAHLQVRRPRLRPVWWAHEGHRGHRGAARHREDLGSHGPSKCAAADKPGSRAAGLRLLRCMTGGPRRVAPVRPLCAERNG